MLTKKDPIITLVLCIVTCGIYQLVWYWKTIEALNNEGHSSLCDLQPIVQFILLFVPYVGTIFFALNADANINIIRRNKGLNELDNKTLWLVLGILIPIVNIVLIQSAINEVADV